MNSRYSYDSYGYNRPSYPQQGYPRQGYNPRQMVPNQIVAPEKKTIMFVVLGFLIVAVIGWIILNFILYKNDSAWFKVYKAPPPPSGAVQPNGDGTGGSLDPAVNTYKNNNLTGLKALNPSTTPTYFGGFISTPP